MEVKQQSICQISTQCNFENYTTVVLTLCLFLQAQTNLRYAGIFMTITIVYTIIILKGDYSLASGCFHLWNDNVFNYSPIKNRMSVHMTVSIYKTLLPCKPIAGNFRGQNSGSAIHFHGCCLHCR